MTSQLGAIAATVSLIVLLILFVVMGINMAYKIGMKEWQGLAIFWSRPFVDWVKVRKMLVKQGVLPKSKQ